MAKSDNGLRPLPLAPEQQTGPAVWKILLGVVADVVVLGFAAQIFGSSGSKPATAATPTRHAMPAVVVYELSGSAASADITIETPTGTSQQSVDVPLVNNAGDTGLTFVGFSSGDFVYISAQNTGDYGDLTCRIKVRGVTISENTASGAYAIASCDGSV